MDAQEKQLAGRWNIDEIKDITEKEIIPGHDSYIDFLGNGKIKMQDVEGTYKNGEILIEEENGKKTTIKIDSINDYLYLSAFEDNKKKGEMILTKDGSQHPETDKEETYDFRKVKWGMSLEKVLASEKGEKRSWQDDLVGVTSTRVAGLKSSILYYFVKDTLTNAAVIIKEKHSNKNEYILEYNKLIEILSTKYGQGDSQVYWKNNLYKGDTDHYGMAISTGHLVYYTTWQTDDSFIELSLSGENYEIDLMLKYLRHKYEYLRIQKKNAKNTSGL